MGFANFLQWLSGTPFSTMMRESIWAEPIVETIHVLTLTIFLGFGCPGDAQASGSDVYSLGFKACHNVLESLAFHRANEVRRRYRKIGKVHLAHVHALVSQFVDIASHGHARGTLLYHERAHAFVCRSNGRIRFREKEERVSVTRVRDPHLGAVDAIYLPVAGRSRSDTLQIGTGV